MDSQQGRTDASEHRPHNERFSSMRSVSLTMASAIDSVLETNDRQHEQMAASLTAVRDQHRSLAHDQRSLGEAVAEVRRRQVAAEDRLGQMEAAQHHIAETVSAILGNQKNGARCYQELTGALSAIRQQQQAAERRLDGLARLLRAVLGLAVLQALASGAALTLLAMLLAG